MTSPVVQVGAGKSIAAAGGTSLECELAFIGGGFRTTTSLASAPRLLKRHTHVFERGPLLGPGGFLDYGIASTSIGSRFLQAVRYDFEGLVDLRQHPRVASVAAAEEPVPLERVALALREIGRALTAVLGPSRVHLDTCVTAIDVARAGQMVSLQTATGSLVVARHAVLATGRTERLHHALGRWHSKVLLSQEVISRRRRAQLAAALSRLDGSSVLIAGCSHSAMSALQVLLQVRSEVALPRLQIKVLQRGPARLMYETLDVARASQVPGRERIFDPDRDVCPATGIVYRDSGLRHESRSLYCSAWAGEIDGVRVVRSSIEGAAAVLDEAALIVQALGYHGEAPDVLVDGVMVRPAGSDDRLRSTDDGGSMIGGQRLKALSILRVEPTPPDRRDNSVYGSGLYDRLAERLERLLDDSYPSQAGQP